jgi:hypothetical protein
VLKASRRVPLREFLFETQRQFLTNTEIHYAQAWAFVTFLRRSTPENEKLFRTLWTKLRENPGVDTWNVVHDIFDEPQLDRLEREFGGWLALKGR